MANIIPKCLGASLFYDDQSSLALSAYKQAQIVLAARLSIKS